MKKILILGFLVFSACKENNHSASEEQNITVTTKDYELLKSSQAKALLIVFPGFAATSKEIKEEFDIIQIASEKNISVLLMNFNRHLWITTEEAENLSNTFVEIIAKHHVNRNKIYIGGMSIGGNVALSLSNHLFESNSDIRPAGVFIVDAPMDLYGLYLSAKEDLKRKHFSEDRLSEPKFIVGLMEDEFGVNDTLLKRIQKVAPVTRKTNNISNIEALRNTRVRFYTEPDTLWWEEVRQTRFEYTNAYAIQKIATFLGNEHWTNLQLIQTKNKGYRSNGEKHPHSWSIVDTDELTDWILE